MNFSILLIILSTVLALGKAHARESHSGFEAYVVGTLHQHHLSKDFGYTLSQIQYLLKSIKPDIICGEISRNHYGTRMQGYYPPESVVVEEAAKQLGAEFYPSDWRGDFYQMQEAEQAMTTSEREAFNSAHDKLLASIPDDLDNLIIFFHSRDTQNLIKEAHEIRIKSGTEIADGYWYARNQAIVKNCVRKAEEISAEKILFTYGVEHVYIIESYLSKYYGIKSSQIPGAVLVNQEMSDWVVSKWKELRSKLQEHLVDDEALQIEKDMIIESNRINKLTRFIESRGLAN